MPEKKEKEKWLQSDPNPESPQQPRTEEHSTHQAVPSHPFHRSSQEYPMAAQGHDGLSILHRGGLELLFDCDFLQDFGH